MLITACLYIHHRLVCTAVINKIKSKIRNITFKVVAQTDWSGAPTEGPQKEWSEAEEETSKKCIVYYVEREKTENKDTYRRAGRRRWGREKRKEDEERKRTKTRTGKVQH